MRQFFEPGASAVDGTPNDVAVSAAGAAAVLTYAAMANNQHNIEGVSWSYSANPQAGAFIQIEDGAGNVVRKWFISTGGPGFMPVRVRNKLANTALILTASAGGGAILASINAENHRFE
jgi:hypothetical protein